ncbi:MAG: bifunctional [glutamine synthetase] adenylyltransferase/[glutamine synthetase]-adenylyl-L-tyrosine phosphorylase [Acidimicrobiales bacterium]|nr:bifunctional [glutamine synthetase] adenylyltransferase/[glutamine synthetase]-adenylyl-L-tyrosine phosphorylase [Acidimicrobiales bacterium]
MDLPDTVTDLGPLPGWATGAVDRILDGRPASHDRVAADPSLAAALVTVVRASRMLTELLVADEGALEVLGASDQAPDRWDPLPADPETLLRQQRRTMLHLAARDLLGIADLVETTACLSDLAGWVLDTAVELVDAEGLAVIGMGKLGAHELNYASDIDLMFVGEGDGTRLARAARRVVEATARCYRVDTALRPEGRDGALVRTVGSYLAYWDRWAEPWEFQALMKASVVGGDPTVGGAFDEAATNAVWHRPFGPDDLRSVRAMKARTEAAVDNRAGGDRDLKLGQGGIRDVEFSVQLLQLVHGQADPALRIQATLPALGELGRAGYIDADDARGLDEAYRFLRRAEHAVQLADGRQVHSLPDDQGELDRIARVLGYGGGPEATPGEQLDKDRKRYRASVRSIHERLYFRPLLEAFAEVPGALTPVTAAARLGAFGFTDANRTRAAVRELTSGLNRTSRLMAQMLPLILDWLSTSPDPDQGLLGLRTLVTDRARGSRITAMFRESPETARRLCILLGTSSWLGDTVSHDPDLVARLPRIGREAPPERSELAESARRTIDWRAEPTDRQGGLRRWKDRQVLAVAVAEILDDASVAESGQRLATIAEATLEAALGAVEAAVPFAIVAAGRLGGHELAYHSDLDLLFVHGGSGADDEGEAKRVSSALMRFVGGSTPAERLYEVDPDLRPEGRQGPLARSLSGFDAYWQRWSAPWERLAMVRARPVAGDPGVADAWAELLDQHLWGSPVSEHELREIRMVKARMESERIPAGEDPRFHLKLGRGALADIELCVQLLQLQHRVRAHGTETGIEALEADGVLPPDDAAILLESYEFCERVRNRWHLLRNGPGDSLPPDPDALRHLARSLDTSPTRLRDEYLRVTRRARVVVEREFYGEA